MKMKTAICVILMFLPTLVFSQKTPTTNLTTGEKEIEISNGRKIIGKSKYKIVLIDSMSKEFGITELPAKKFLFFNKTYSYIESTISEVNDNGYKVRRKYIIRIYNEHVDFERSKGQDLFFESKLTCPLRSTIDFSSSTLFFKDFNLNPPE